MHAATIAKVTLANDFSAAPLLLVEDDEGDEAAEPVLEAVPEAEPLPLALVALLAEPLAATYVAVGAATELVIDGVTVAVPSSARK